MTPLKVWFIDVLNLRACAPLPPMSDWLSDAEQEEGSRWRNPGRRQDWLGGRWLLKNRIWRILSEQASNPRQAALRDIEIHSRDGIGRTGPPRASLAGRCLPWQNSIAHDDGRIGTAISTSPAVRLGIDIVRRGLSPSVASADWLTASERGWLRRADDPELASTLWGIKESVYKATNRGEAFVPARIDVRPDGDGDFDWTYLGRRRGDEDALQIHRWDGCLMMVACVVTPHVDRSTADD